MAPRILLDLSTSLQWRGKHAVGIVRTEREIATRLLQDESIDVLPVVFQSGRFFAIDPEQALELVNPKIASEMPTVKDEEPVEEEQWRGGGHRPGIGRSIFGRFTAIVRFFARGAIRCVPSHAREDFRLTLVHAREVVRKFLYGREGVTEDLSPAPARAKARSEENPIDLRFVVHPNSQDVLFLGGLGWDVIDCRSVAALRRQSNMKISSVMYDLIPTKFPKFLGGDPRDYFLNYFIHMVDLSDHVFCISKTTQGDLREFCTQQGRQCPSSSVIYLGANLPSAPDERQIDEKLRERLRKGRFALSVGTFEIRKNYGLLLDLWEELLADPDFDLDLVIAGMPGWGSEDVIERLEASPYYGRRIFWFKKLPDSGLSWLYRHCHLFLFPSLYEGWGLPVIEALQHGKPVIASNRGSVPEAGLGVATIIDPDDLGAWIDAVKKAARSNSVLPEVELPSWEAAAAEVKNRLLAIQ